MSFNFGLNKYTYDLDSMTVKELKGLANIKEVSLRGKSKQEIVKTLKEYYNAPDKQGILFNRYI